MQFSSKEPFNDDPEPYVCGSFPVIRHSSYAIEWNSCGYEYKPRPEYTVIPNNPTNPILTDFRELHQSTGNDLWTDAYLSWENLLEEWESHPLEQWHHAMDVLGKITRIYKGAKE